MRDNEVLDTCEKLNDQLVNKYENDGSQFIANIGPYAESISFSNRDCEIHIWDDQNHGLYYTDDDDIEREHTLYEYCVLRWKEIIKTLSSIKLKKK